MQHGWTRRLPGTRAVQLTPEGERAFREVRHPACVERSASTAAAVAAQSAGRARP
jgi:hypothetical protein